MKHTLPAWVFLLLLCGRSGPAQTVTIADRMHHLRSGEQREWNEFPEQAESAGREWQFTARRNEQPWTLQLRQQDVKQAWQITLNETRLGSLVIDENDMRLYFDVPRQALVDGPNVLRIESAARGDRGSDDIRVGQMVLHPTPRDQVLSESRLRITVTQAGTDRPLPSRITVVDQHGTLQTTSAESGGNLAVRAGTIYTADGRADFELPAGAYTIYAGRGFEYSLATETIMVAAGEQRELALALRREVPTPGYVACDTHIHTRTHSGHGDATVEERMITLAAEGIELPIATDHNAHVDHAPYARQLGVSEHFTPVIGNEVTTPVGHFNIFPVEPGAAIPPFRLQDWTAILDGIYATPGVKVAILNHARDLHSGVRPFGPDRFNPLAGENLDGWPIGFNAMEVVNSSANQTDILRLFHDWMALLNRGYQVTPVGSSDSHDVARHFVGQGRTYIRVDDSDPAAIDVDAAVHSFLQGRVLVSFGLLVELTVADKYRSGELARIAGDRIEADVRVLGPHWTQADQLLLLVNGQLVEQRSLPAGQPGQTEDGAATGLKYQGRWSLPRPPHDVHLVAIALGPGIELPCWKTAKPYQPTSADWAPRVLGCSGAVWVDADGDGRRSAAFDYAREVVAEAAASDSGRPLQPGPLLERLRPYDRAVAVQAAHLYQQQSGDLHAPRHAAAIRESAAHVRDAVGDYLETWRASQRARAERGLATP